MFDIDQAPKGQLARCRYQLGVREDGGLYARPVLGLTKRRRNRVHADVSMLAIDTCFGKVSVDLV